MWISVEKYHNLLERIEKLERLSKVIDEIKKSIGFYYKESPYSYFVNMSFVPGSEKLEKLEDYLGIEYKKETKTTEGYVKKEKK